MDVIYVGTIHTMHFEHAQLALTNGKHVLVEKPIAMNAKQLMSLMQLSRDRNLFLMEGLKEHLLCYQV